MDFQTVTVKARYNRTMLFKTLKEKEITILELNIYSIIPKVRNEDRKWCKVSKFYSLWTFLRKLLKDKLSKYNKMDQERGQLSDHVAPVLNTGNPYPGSMG